MAIQDRNLTAGTRLVATYKKEVYVCDVEAGEYGKLTFLLEDGRRFKSPSSAAGALMGGKAVNGWLFWSIGEAGFPGATETPESQPPASAAAKPGAKKLLYRLPNQKGLAEGKSRWFCNGCMKSFLVDLGAAPEVCHEGHRAPDGLGPIGRTDIVKPRADDSKEK